MIIGISLVVLFFLVLLGMSIRFTQMAIYPKVRTHENALSREMEIGNWSYESFEELEKESFTIPSPRGYDLFGYVIPYPNSKKTIVFAHGITYNLFGSVKYMWMFRKWGFNIVLYDHRNHGMSGGNYTTFGYYEKMDLSLVLDYVEKRFGQNSLIGTHGESMGAATVLQHVAIDNRVRFVIADCPFESAYSEFKYRLSVEYKLPSFPIIPLASVICKVKSGAGFHQMSPIATIESVEKPVMWIHGLDDDYVPPEHSLRMYEKKKGPKAYYWVQGARHAKAYYTDPEAYENSVSAFLKENGFIHELAEMENKVEGL